MKIEHITNIDIDARSFRGSKDESFALTWEDSATTHRFHIWFNNADQLSTLDIEQLQILHKNPRRGVQFRDTVYAGYFDTRSLDAAAKSNRDAVQYVRAYAVSHDLHGKARADLETQRAEKIAFDAECERTDKIRDHAEELLAALESLVRRFGPFEKKLSDGFHSNLWTIPAMTQARAAIKAATAA